MYADKITASMQKTIDETNYRRAKQIAYNTQHHITPTGLNKKISNDLIKPTYDELMTEQVKKVAEDQAKYYSKEELQKLINSKRKEMEKAAMDLNFMLAAQLRDEIQILKDKL